MSVDYKSYARCFINGEYAEDTERGFPLKNPANGKVVVEKVQEAGPKEVDAAVDAAIKASHAWAESPPSVRAECLRKLADLMVENASTLAELDAVSMGKPVLAHNRECGLAAKHLKHAADLAETYLGGTASTNTPGFFNFSLKVPYGVVAGICPWNVPVIMLTAKAGPAIAAGNCMIIKTSEKSPLSGSFIAGLTVKAGFPPGVLQVLSGAGLTGKLLSEHMKIRKISFTGSTRTGRAVQESAAKSNLKDVVLELGGKSPAIVLADADIAQAVKALSFSLWANSGQICMASTRVYVHESIFQQFLEQYKAALSQVKKGDPTDKTTMMGPLADEVQYKSVQSFLNAANGSATVSLGGASAEQKEGYYVNPTIFTDVADDAKINTDEIFGPVAVLHSFTDDEEVIRRANDSEYGLFASVFTRDINKALNYAKYLEAGNVAVNCSSPLGASDMEFGGVKQSGIGREGGPRSLENWLETKSVYVALSGL
ncbi:aldehyde dehydrogenase [Cystobasidium minutum MCA 4210]|uniref:aldehyde dehydrogenase n=1 Tax=Cystobasidium minutum MCA 4210 TaxID=1397322 RepID=UPI0034CD399E|eukprot:jgi/Rhomi1/62457/CE62456_1457